MLEFLRSAEEAARLGGQVLRSWANRVSVKEKSRANLVTEADFASQQAIHGFLSRRYPHHGFLGEEELCDVQPDSQFRWVIDPLDGTTNYVHGFPYYCVSIGLEKDGELVVGAIYNPVSEEMFLAATGQGATVNRQPLKCSAVNSLGEAMLIASLPVATSPEDEAVMRFLRVLGHAQTVQRTGSAALNLAYLAAGRIDGFWSASLKPWDMAAGVLIAKEAGASITSLDGGRFRLDVPSMLATNGTSLHDRLVELMF